MTAIYLYEKNKGKYTNRLNDLYNILRLSTVMCLKCMLCMERY